SSTQEHDATVPSPEGPVIVRKAWSCIASEPTRRTCDRPAASSSMRISPASELDPPYTSALHPEAAIACTTEAGIASSDGIVLRSTTWTEELRATARANARP